MSLIFNNTEVEAVEFNGVDLDEVYFNNELVFQKGGGGLLQQGILSKSYPNGRNFIAEFTDNYTRVHLSTPNVGIAYANCACCFEIDFDEVNEITVDWDIISKGNYGVAIGIGTNGELNNNETSTQKTRSEVILNIAMLLFPAGSTVGTYTQTFDVSAYSDVKYFSFSTDVGDEAYINAVRLKTKNTQYVPYLTGSMSYTQFDSVAEYDGKNFILQTSGSSDYYMYTMASLELDFTNLNSITIIGTGIRTGETGDMWIGVGDYNEVQAEPNSKYFAIKYLDGWYDVTANVQHTITGDVSDITGTHYLNIMCDRGVGFRITDIIIT